MDIERLFEKFVNNTLSKKEYRAFMNFLANPEHRHRIEGLMKEHWKKTDRSDNPMESGVGENRKERYEKIRKRIHKNSETEKKVGRRKLGSHFVYKAAAGVTIVIVSFFLLKHRPGSDTAPAVKSKYHNAVTLKLDDGNVKVIFAEDEQNVVDTEGNVIGVQKEGRITYYDSVASAKPTYNELAVPYGNQFDLVLSDGTQIKLNAGSWLKYPTRFTEGHRRQVFLRGEAYFDVAKDQNHPFIVTANDIDVEVLGTAFNVSFYPEDPEINTVLVEGEVKMHQKGDEKSEGNSIVLQPGQKASWHKQNETMQVAYTDVELYTAWKDGVLLFRKTPFNIIRKKLERHFDISIQNDNAYLEDQVYTASFKEENIYEILDAFQEDTPFKYNYSAESNTIMITQDPSKINAYE